MALADLADAESVEALVPAAEEMMGSVDILVNNAGVTRDNLFMRMKDAEWDTVIAVDLTAAFRLSRAAVKGMMRRRFGRIINIASIVGVKGNGGQAQLRRSQSGDDRHVQVAGARGRQRAGSPSIAWRPASSPAP